MMLLQWPRFFRSPSRNHTPGAICSTLSGLASPRETKKAVNASTAKVVGRMIGRIERLYPNLSQINFLLVELAQSHGAGEFDMLGLFVDEFVELVRRVVYRLLHSHGEAF